MSQEDVYNILKDLGGEATTKEIRDEAKRRYPYSSLHMLVVRRLRKLELYKVVKSTQIDNETRWKILKKLI